MVSAEEENEALAYPQYWDSRYALSDGSTPTHEWFKTFKALEPFLQRHLFEPSLPAQNPRILHLGSGDSTVPYDLHARGYRNQLCLDFSPVVVDLMKKRDIDGIEWLQGDVRQMDGVPSGSVDVAFDKGTLDAMIHGSPWSPPDDVIDNSQRYMKEVARTLAQKGVFLYVTFRQPHFVRPLLNRDNLWTIELETLQEDESSFDYYAFVLRKVQCDHD